MSIAEMALAAAAQDATREYRKELVAMRRELETLKAELKLPYFAMWLLRNFTEDDDHVTAEPLPPRNIEASDIAFYLDEEAEQIYAAAVAAGHDYQHAVVAIFRKVPGNGDDEEIWEFQRISPVLTEAFYGTPEAQQKAIDDGREADKQDAA